MFLKLSQKLLLFTVFGVALAACGKGGENNTLPQGQVKIQEAKLENGILEVEASYGMLSIVNRDSRDLIVPEGPLEGLKISSVKLASIIERELDDVSEVYGLSFVSYVDPAEIIDFFNITGTDFFSLLFSARTVSYGVRRFQCEVVLRRKIVQEMEVWIKGCVSKKFELEFNRFIKLKDIVADGENFR